MGQKCCEDSRSSTNFQDSEDVGEDAPLNFAHFPVPMEPGLQMSKEMSPKNKEE